VQFPEPLTLGPGHALPATAGLATTRVDIVTAKQRLISIDPHTATVTSSTLTRDEYIAQHGGAMLEDDGVALLPARGPTLQIKGGLIGVGADGLTWIDTSDTTQAFNRDGRPVATFPDLHALESWPIDGGLIVNRAGGIYLFDARTTTITLLARGEVETVQHDQIFWTRCDHDATCDSFIGSADDLTRTPTRVQFTEPPQNPVIPRSPASSSLPMHFMATALTRCSSSTRPTPPWPRSHNRSPVPSVAHGATTNDGS